jgi:hypothetical protein
MTPIPWSKVAASMILLGVLGLDDMQEFVQAVSAAAKAPELHVITSVDAATNQFPLVPTLRMQEEIRPSEAIFHRLFRHQRWFV